MNIDPKKILKIIYSFFFKTHNIFQNFKTFRKFTKLLIVLLSYLKQLSMKSRSGSKLSLRE